MSVPVVIALGGNLGDVRATGEAALALMNDTPGLEVQRVSQWYSTEPVGCEGRFLNAAALLQCELTPTRLLMRLHEIESAQGRVRTGHWTPRTLDLDIVLFGRWQVAHPRLILPHPASWHRRFVLDPACEVAGDEVHARTELTLHQLRERLLPRPLVIGWDADLPLASIISGEVQSRFGSRIHWAETGEEAIVRFAAAQSASLDPFEIVLPYELSVAQRIVGETLTALLDEPVPVGK